MRQGDIAVFTSFLKKAAQEQVKKVLDLVANLSVAASQSPKSLDIAKVLTWFSLRKAIKLQHLKNGHNCSFISFIDDNRKVNQEPQDV